MSWSGIILVIVGALLLANNFDLFQSSWMQRWWRPVSGQRRGAATGSEIVALNDPDWRP